MCFSEVNLGRSVPNTSHCFRGLMGVEEQEMIFSKDTSAQMTPLWATQRLHLERDNLKTEVPFYLSWITSLWVPLTFLYRGHCWSASLLFEQQTEGLFLDQWKLTRKSGNCRSQTQPESPHFTCNSRQPSSLCEPRGWMMSSTNSSTQHKELWQLHSSEWQEYQCQA